MYIFDVNARVETKISLLLKYLWLIVFTEIDYRVYAYT